MKTSALFYLLASPKRPVLVVLEIRVTARRHQQRGEQMSVATSEADLLESGPVARELNIAVETLRYWERTGQIAPARRTPSGRRIYSRDEVETIRRERAVVKALADTPLDAA